MARFADPRFWQWMLSREKPNSRQHRRAATVQVEPQVPGYLQASTLANLSDFP